MAEPQLRWLGPEKGVIHMATGAVLNALWDLRAKREGKPLWELLAALSPEAIVDLVDFRYLSDALTPDQALAILRAAEPGRARRADLLRAEGYPAYTTSPGWLGYDDAKLERLAKEAVQDGFRMIKLKVGRDVEEDVRRMGIARACVGPDIDICVDANQRWEVGEAIDWMRKLAEFRPLWIEEPTSPDDILGHAKIRDGVAPVLVATGEHIANRIVFKQMLAAGSLDILQLDATRVGGVNENIAILLLAAKFRVPVCPHAGGVGLCELVQHLSMFDLVAVSGRSEGRVIEYVDHLHEHFLEPVIIEDGQLQGTQPAGLQQPDVAGNADGLPLSRWESVVGTSLVAVRLRLAGCLARENRVQPLHGGLKVDPHRLGCSVRVLGGNRLGNREVLGPGRRGLTGVVVEAVHVEMAAQLGQGVADHLVAGKVRHHVVETRVIDHVQPVGGQVILAAAAGSREGTQLACLPGRSVGGGGFGGRRFDQES